MSAGVALVVVVIAILLAVSPIGIWNRLIKINAAQKKTQEQLDRVIKLLEYIAQN